MGSQAILIVILLSVCQGDGQQYSAQKCHFAFILDPSVCKNQLKPAVCSNGGVISVTSIQYKDDNGNIPLADCCTETDGDFPTEIKENLYKECNNKSSCNFASVNSGTLKIQYTCTAPDRSILTTSDVGSGTSVLYQYTITDMYETRATKGATTMATTDVAVSPNPQVHSETSKGVPPQILIASLLGVLAVLITAAILVAVACKRRKQRKLLRQPDVYELESSTRVPVLEATAPYEVPEEMNTPNDEQDNEYDKATFAMSHANANRDRENTYDVASASGDQKHVTMSGDNVYDVATNLPKLNGTNGGDNDYGMTPACINNKCINGDDEDGYEQTSNFANNSNATTNEDNVYDFADHNIKN